MVLIDEVEEVISKYKLLDKGDRVLIGVSGGPDSLVLLHILHRLKKKYRFYLHIAHLDHRLRGFDSQEDANFVKRFGESLNIPVTIRGYDVNEYSQKEGLSLEDAARRVRYNFFCDLSKELDIDKIALGHHLKDQAETVLMKLIRGAGLKGLGGIRPKVGKIVRPLIEVDREDIEEYCQSKALEARIDKSNFDKSYFRNKVRLELIPFLEEGYNNNLVSTLNRTANLLRDEEDFLQNYIEDTIAKVILSKEEQLVTLDASRLLKEHIAIRRRVVREILKILRSNYKDFYYKHIEDILDFISEGDTGTAIDLPRGVKVCLNYNQVLFSIGQVDKGVQSFSCQVEVKSDDEIKVDIDNLNLRLEVKVVDREYPWRASLKDPSIGLFDYKKVGERFIVRERQDGDRFYPLGMKGSKKVKDFLIDLKIPLFQRDKIPIFKNQKEEIFWVGGYRIDNRFKIRDETDKIMIIKTINRGE